MVDGEGVFISSFHYTVSHSHHILRTPFLLYKFFSPPSRHYLLPSLTIFTPSSETHGQPRIVGVYKLAMGFRRCLHPSSSLSLTHKSRTSSYPTHSFKPLQIRLLTFFTIPFSRNLYFKNFTIQNKMNESL